MANSFPYRLGLDLGSASLGWAVIELKQGKNPIRLRDAGVRIFEAGVEGDIEQGKDSSRAAVRRDARQPRRQQWRRQHRKQKLFRLLQEFELLPASEQADAAARKELLDKLDATLTEKLIPAGDHDAHQKLPYLLRDRAVSTTVEPFELGRALYHLGQRRGYLSNRKGDRKDDEETGLVLGAISEMDQKLSDEQLTLGAYFHRKVKPEQERIRRRWLGRGQFQDEFAKIKLTQEKNFPRLQEQQWKRLYDAIFHQRPLKSQKHLIGRCDLETDRMGKGLRRCPLALPIAQEFRILQKVNDLRVTTSDRHNDPLSIDERQKLLQALNETADLTWAKVKSLLKLGRNTKFSLEEWDDKLLGHRTNAKMLAVFGQRWFDLSSQEQTAIALDVLHYRKPEKLAERAQKVWGLDRQAATTLARTHLEDDYARHSRQAMERLINGTDKIPGMKQGASYSTVRRGLYPEQFSAGKIEESLPPVNHWKDDIRNPAVIRALTELRKVVNSLIQRYGKPEEIHIELARDLRNSRLKRKEIWRQNEEKRKRREKAIELMLQESISGRPNRRQIDKWLLAEECNWECPYCGKRIKGRALLGDDAEFNIEHIYPRRYLDDSYLNKTIACRTCNDKKGDRTPAAAFSGEQFEEILARVAHFQGSAREVKLARFKTEVPSEDFTERQLNDTRHNSRLAAEYLQLLFGGRSDSEGRQRIVTPTGQLTAKVRGSWELNDLLGAPDGLKDREDHRHHAIDAVVIGLLSQKQIKRLADVAQSSEKQHSRLFFESIPFPWKDFKQNAIDVINALRVSHRPTRSIAGPLHAESIYSRNQGTEKQPEHRIRKHLSKLTAKEINGDQIVDSRVREAVQQKYAELGKGLPSKLWGGNSEENFPRLEKTSGEGNGSIIRKVRLRVDARPRTVGKGMSARNYASGKDSNYASLIYAVVNERGEEIRWEHEIVDRLTAHQFLSANHTSSGEKVLIPHETENRKFKFALRKNDMLIAQGETGDEVLYRIQKFSQDEIQLCEHYVSTITNDRRTPWNRIQSIDKLRKRCARMVFVSPSGKLIDRQT